MKFLERLNFAKKLYLLLAVPVVALIIYTMLLMSSTYADVNKFKDIQRLSELSIKLSDVLHETQKERGLSAGYAGSDGTKFRVQLSNQRALTDKKIGELFSFVKGFDYQEYGDELSKNLKESLARLKNLPNHRSKVDSISESTKSLISYYTQTNKIMLDTVAVLAKNADNAKISNKINSYLNFLQAKEKMGVERAVGTGTLAKGAFGSGMKQYFISLVAAQKAYLNNFINSATPKIITAYNAIYQDPIIKSVSSIERSLMREGDVTAINASAQKWFDNITYKINKFKEIENMQSNDILSSTKELYSDAKNLLITHIITSIIMFIAIGMFALVMIRRFNSQVKKLQDGLGNFLAYIAREEGEPKHIDIVGKDEFAQMTKMINSQIDKISQMLEQDKRVVNEIEYVVKKVSNGFFGNSVHEKASSKELEHLRKSLNSMLKSTTDNFSILIEILNKYSQGKFDIDISHEMTKNLNGDFGAVVTSIRLLGDNVSELLAIIQETGGCLNENTHILSDSSSSLSSHAITQQEALDNTTKALERMKITTKESIANVKDSSRVADELTASSQKGLLLASKTQEATKLINEEVEAIDEAITVIDQIAFQTNILSLNAAVEAATAGEAGKGFSVVAQEVRNLATKSSEAAAQIKQLVESAKARSLEGAKISTEMIDGYNVLKENIQKTKSIISQVEQKSKIQEADMNKIDKVVGELEDIVTKNVEIADSVGSLSHGITELSENLFNVVSSTSFKKEMSSQICDVELNKTVATMKNKHFLFKTKILSKLTGEKRFDVVSHNSCDLGRWMLDQEGRDVDFTRTSAWSMLQEEHKKMHQLAQDYVDKNAQNAEFEELKDIAVNLESTTAKIFQTLDGVRKAKCDLLKNQKEQKAREISKVS